MDRKELMSLQELAEAEMCALNTIYNTWKSVYQNKHGCRFYKIRKRLYIDRRDYRRYLENTLVQRRAS